MSFAEGSLRKGMGERGREIILRDFTGEIVFGKTLLIYRSLMGRLF